MRRCGSPARPAPAACGPGGTWLRPPDHERRDRTGPTSSQDKDHNTTGTRRTLSGRGGESVMKSRRGKQLLRKIGLTGCMMLLGWFSPGPGTAAVEKVDVCHREGNGNFHLITVAAQACPPIGSMATPCQANRCLAFQAISLTGPVARC